MSELVYILPVHNEAAVLASNTARATSYLERFKDAEVYLVENGSDDRSWEIAEEIEDESQANSRDAAREARPRAVRVRAFREPRAGIGFAYHRGLSEAVAAFGASRTRWAVLTAADLPFGFSDLEAAMVLLERAPSRIFVGSKAHPESRAERGIVRRAMTLGYRTLRRTALGMRVADSQGSVLLRLDLASELLPRIAARGFFYSTELCYLAETSGHLVELPVVLEASQRPSTVKPLKHGLEMARNVWALRRRESPR